MPQILGVVADLTCGECLLTVSQEPSYYVRFSSNPGGLIQAGLNLADLFAGYISNQVSENI